MGSERMAVAEAALRFADVVNCVVSRQRTFLLTQDGAVVAKLTPVDREPTGSELALVWRERPLLDPVDASVWAEELAALKAADRKPDGG